jgi:hypothetical protein
MADDLSTRTTETDPFADIRAAVDQIMRDRVARPNEAPADPFEIREEFTIPAAWSDTRIERRLRKAMQTPGFYTARLIDRISPQRIRRIIAAVNVHYTPREGGISTDWRHDQRGSREPLLEIASLPIGPYEYEGRPL